ncbi:hypothetical protein V6N13_131038 [Hibiscus sabdariffa]
MSDSIVVTPSGQWDIATLMHVLLEECVHRILKVYPPSHILGLDQLYWKGDANRTFTTKSAYGLLRGNERDICRITDAAKYILATRKTFCMSYEIAPRLGKCGDRPFTFASFVLLIASAGMVCYKFTSGWTFR